MEAQLRCRLQDAGNAVSAALGFVAAWTSWDWRWIVSAVLILANWPFTLIGIMPTNHKLKATTEIDVGPTSRAMLVSWGRLHAVCTGLGVAATLWSTVADPTVLIMNGPDCLALGRHDITPARKRAPDPEAPECCPRGPRWRWCGGPSGDAAEFDPRHG